MIQTNFLDSETGLTPPSPVFKPSEESCSEYRARILEALQNAGEGGVSGLLMRDICPCSATQRISEVRAELERHGKTVKCTRVGTGSVYRIEPYTTKGSE